MTHELRDVTGFRGERIVELCLTDYREFSRPLFKPGFLGEKWPTIDFYVELTGVRNRRLYFFGQAKATTAKLTSSSANLKISTKRKDIVGLRRIPGPTYILGVHEPSSRVFVRAVHAGTPARAITNIPLSHELNSSNLQALHDEVRLFWSTTMYKPTQSVFS